MIFSSYLLNSKHPQLIFFFPVPSLNPSHFCTRATTMFSEISFLGTWHPTQHALGILFPSPSNNNAGKKTLVQITLSLAWIYLNISLICLPASCPCSLILCPYTLQSVLNTVSRVIILKPKSDKFHILLTEIRKVHKNIKYSVSFISIGKTNLTW